MHGEAKSFETINIFSIQMYGPILKQIWPRRKKVKRQCTTIILATLVDLPSLIVSAKIRPQGILCSREEDF